MAVDEWAECAKELIGVADETRGNKRQLFIIGNRRFYGLSSAIDLNNIPVDGGWDFSGSYTIQIPLADFKGKLSQKNQDVVGNGVTMRVYSVNQINAMVEILVANITQ